MKDDEIFLMEFRDDSIYVRREAARALGNIGGTHAVEPLIRALRDNDAGVRDEAAWALGKIGDARAVEPLIRAFGDSDAGVRRKAAMALGKIGDARAVETLIRALKDSSILMHWGVAETLVKIGTPAVEPLIRALGDSDSHVRAREEAAEALGKIGDVRAVEPLIMVLRNSNSAVRWKAAEALNKLHWSPASNIEKVYYFIARQDWSSVVSVGVLALELLIKVQGDNNTDVQKNATDTLNKICSQITEIFFGEISSNNTKTCVKNLETSQLTIPMSGLTKIHIDADTYDFDMVERFITYSINYVGQKHLKKKVEVHIYGSPEKLHPNLLNSFKNLCRKVIIQGKE